MKKRLLWVTAVAAVATRVHTVNVMSNWICLIGALLFCALGIFISYAPHHRR